MTKKDDQVMVLAGYGPGIGDAVVKKFAKEGYKVAIMSGNEKELQSCLDELSTQKIVCKAYQVDFTDPNATRQAMIQAHEALGPITCLIWNGVKDPKSLME
ncbi:hypothetical protein HDU76_002393, partial [Blyttiomyces sp. JEL0837]